MSRTSLALCTALALLLSSGGVYAASLGSAERAIQSKDYSKAINQLEPLVKDNNAKAMYLLGTLYQQGLGTEAQPDKARTLFKQAAQQGNLDALNALRDMKQAQYRKEFPKLLAAAEAGDAKAQNTVGEMYEYGRGVERDPAEALKWYRKAADQGEVRAWHNMGRAYNFGQGVSQDYVEAEKWYRKAAAQGDNEAMFFLGTLYATGHGENTSTDSDILAYAWLALSAQNGNSTAAAISDRLKMKLSASQLQQAKQLSSSLPQTLSQN